VEHNAKTIAVKVNKSLDSLGVPVNSRERANILSKMLAISKPQAWGLLEGLAFPDGMVLKKLATELEIKI
jgi:hypothetical protein